MSRSSLTECSLTFFFFFTKRSEHVDTTRYQSTSSLLLLLSKYKQDGDVHTSAWLIDPQQVRSQIS